MLGITGQLRVNGNLSLRIKHFRIRFILPLSLVKFIRAEVNNLLPRSFPKFQCGIFKLEENVRQRSDPTIQLPNEKNEINNTSSCRHLWLSHEVNYRSGVKLTRRFGSQIYLLFEAQWDLSSKEILQSTRVRELSLSRKGNNRTLRMGWLYLNHQEEIMVLKITNLLVTLQDST